jgi:hypothetical protein
MSEDFNWIAMIDTLAGGDITKYETIYDIEYETCMFKMLYDHHRDKYHREINRRQELQRRG